VNQAEFLDLVVPQVDEGFITIHWKIPEKQKNSPRTVFHGRAFKTAVEAAAFVASLHGKGCDVWFATARHRTDSGTRTKASAQLMGSVFVDGDINPDDPKCFPTLQEALVAILKFCADMGIPEPSLIVMSGGGIHVYWLSDKHLDIETWQEFADALRNAMEHTNLRVKDKGLTTDAARVLRPPDTVNYKPDKTDSDNWMPRQRAVRLLEDFSPLTRHDFSTVFAPLKKFAPVVKRKSNVVNFPPAAKAFAHLDPHKNLGAGVEDMIVPFEPIKAGCAWLREAYETGGRDFPEPQWTYSILCATWMEDGNALAHQFANQHPDYDYGTTQERWDRKIRERRNPGIGWPGCRAISNSGSGHCKSCPRFALGKSPLHLGLGAADAAPVQPQQAQQGSEKYQEELKEVGGSRPEELRLPEGFALDEKGRICAFFPSEVIQKAKIQIQEPAQLIHILKTQIREPTLQHQGGLFGLGFIAATDKGNEHEVFVPSNSLTVGQGLVKTLGDRFVIHNTNKKVFPDMLDKFATSWIDLLRVEDTATRDSGTLGWRYEDGKITGFVHGATFYRTDGTSLPLLATGQDEFRVWYMPVGKKKVWLKAAKLLTDRKRPQLDILIAIGFAAPLTAFGGTLYGATLSMWGDPGTSKSTAQQVAAAIYGHPKQTRESLNSTPKSVQKRLGLTKNLAAYWDDVQDERHQDNLFTTMFVAAGGLEGGRLNQDASMKERLEWQTLLVACSNASFIEYLTHKQKSTTAGMRRVFEIEFRKDKDEPGIIDAVDASLTFAALEHNYGVMGAEYAQVLAACHNEIAAAVESETKRFKAAVDGSLDESFWWGLCGVLLVGARLANQLGAELDVEAMDDFLQVAFQQNRDIRRLEGTEGGTQDNTEAGLTSFVNKFSGEGNILYTKTLYVKRGVEVGQIEPPGGNKQIMIQVARDQCQIVISKKEFRDYLHRCEIHSRQVFDGLKTFFKAEEVKLTLGAGTAYAQSQEWCFVIPVPLNDHDHPLRETLFRRGPPQPHLQAKEN
jgi:hypothetical protein